MSRDFFSTYALHPHYTSPRGCALNAPSWQTEAPLRMLLNNLEVAEDPDKLADIAVFEGESPYELFYRQGALKPKQVFKRGKCILSA